MTAFGRVTEIWRYPVSSLGGERLETVALDAEGVEGDRLWGVMDLESGEVAQPERRKRWRPAPNLKSRTNGSGIEIGGEGAAWRPVESEAAAELASARLGFAVALRRHAPFGEAQPDRVAPRYQRSHIHILTSASIARLEALLPQAARVDPRRFRPNLVIETEPGFEGFVEAGLVGHTLAIGAARIVVSEPCRRCGFTTLAQDDLPFDPAILQAIAREGRGAFGALCTVAAPASLAVGNRVELLDMA